MSNEKWLPVVFYGAGDRYMVSSYGRVWCNKNQTFISPVLAGGIPYWYVNMSKTCGNRVLKRVHRLVAIAFIPIVEGKPDVDHIDINRYNNSLYNLRWVTKEENNNNKINTIKFKGKAITLHCREEFEQAITARDYIIRTKKTLGCSDDQAQLKYEAYLQDGTKGSTLLDLSGSMITLKDFIFACEITYKECDRLLASGLSYEDISLGRRYKVKDSTYYRDRSIEISLSGGDVGLLFPSRVALAKSLGLRSGDSLKVREALYSTYDDYKKHKYSVRVPTEYELDGLVGSITELSLEMGISITATRKLLGKEKKDYYVSPEIPNKRYYVCEGIIRNKKWVLSHYLPDVTYSNANSNMNRLKLSMLELLAWYGVDTSGLSIITKDP